MNISLNLIFYSIRVVDSSMKSLKKSVISCFALLMIGFSMPSAAVFTIEITSGTTASIPIAIVPFSLEGAIPTDQQPADIIESDLGLSGRFEIVPRSSFLNTPDDLESIRFKDWRLIKSEVLVVGKVIYLGNDQYEVRFRLVDVFRGAQVVGHRYTVNAKQIRKLSHQISDIIYQTLTGRAGAFDTQLAFITVRGADDDRQYFLQVADSDGWNAKTVLESKHPILSPSWSPDSSRLAYVSFEDRHSMIFVQSLRTGKRDRVAMFEGLNSAPAWSPDGSMLALTLSKDGNSEIYIYDFTGGKLRRLTRHTAIDTEPAWSPDGDSIIFTSGRAGGPQIYQMPAAGGLAQRLTFQGDYNANASFSPDGKSIVMITNQGNGYKVGIYSTETRTTQELTDSRDDESPSFAPNGDVIIYATKQNGENVLATVSADGQVQQILNYQGGLSIREPAWSPFTRKL